MKVNFIEDNCNIVNNGQFNMDFDVKMLDFAIENQIDYAIVRFYQWYPRCISLGRNQKKDCYNNLGIDVVTRPSGGRALLHDSELTYCFISRAFKESIIESYKDISDALILGFKKLGIELEYASGEHKNLNYCMNISSGADIAYQGKKFIGSAQCRKQGYILQHGSILLDYDKKLLEKLFNENISTDTIISLKEINPQITTDDVINCFNSYISSLE